MMKISLPWWVAVAFTFGAVACSSVGLLEDVDASGPEEECPRGQVWDGERCVRGGGGGVRDTGNGDDPLPPPDDAGDSELPNGDEDVDPDRVCEPAALFCVDADTAASCAEDGRSFDELPCEDDTTCRDGSCVLGTPSTCTPGEVLRCSSPTSLALCADNGLDTTTQACPSDAPNCRGNACTAQLCDASRSRCDGNNVVRCSDDGLSEIFVETCDTGCSSGACSDPCAGDGKSYVGCGFFAVDLDNYSACTTSSDCSGSCVEFECSDGGANNEQFAVSVSNTGASPVEVSVYDGSENVVATATVAVGQIESIPLPRADINNSGIQNSAYRIETTGPVTVHQFNPQNNSDAFSNDASLLLPATSLGSEYLVMGWPTVGSPTGPMLKGFVSIVGVVEGDTVVTVTSPVATMPGPGNVPPALAPGVPTEFTIQRSTVLQFATQRATGADLTGMEIRSTNPVSVFAGSECAQVPVGTSFCDHIEQQLFPVDTWGRDYVLGKFISRGTENDVYRIMASVDGTVIRVSPNPGGGVDGMTLNRGQFIQFESDRDMIVGATQPVSVAQFMVGSGYARPGGTCNPNAGISSGCAIPRSRSCPDLFGSPRTAIGDPAFLMNVPNNQFRRDYVFLVPSDYVENYITVIAPQGATLTLDGAPITGDRQRGAVGSWDVIRAPVSVGVRRIDASAPIGLYVYGYDCDVSYAYPGGLDLDDGR